jgi:hypothetical protein
MKKIILSLAIVFSLLHAVPASAYPPIGVCFTPSGVQMLTGDQTQNYVLKNYTLCPNRVNNPEKPVTSNGCGGAQWWARPPHVYAGVDLTGCCDFHDTCYSYCHGDAETGGQWKDHCDAGLGNCIQNKVNAIQTQNWHVLELVRAGGLGVAQAYYQGMRFIQEISGQDYYGGAQKECLCCDPYGSECLLFAAPVGPVWANPPFYTPPIDLSPDFGGQ